MYQINFKAFQQIDEIILKMEKRFWFPNFNLLLWVLGEESLTCPCWFLGMTEMLLSGIAIYYFSFFSSNNVDFFSFSVSRFSKTSLKKRWSKFLMYLKRYVISSTCLLKTFNLEKSKVQSITIPILLSWLGRIWQSQCVRDFFLHIIHSRSFSFLQVTEFFMNMK